VYTVAYELQRWTSRALEKRAQLRKDTRKHLLSKIRARGRVPADDEGFLKRFNRLHRTRRVRYAKNIPPITFRRNSFRIRVQYSLERRSPDILFFPRNFFVHGTSTRLRYSIISDSFPSRSHNGLVSFAPSTCLPAGLFGHYGCIIPGRTHVIVVTHAEKLLLIRVFNTHWLSCWRFAKSHYTYAHVYRRWAFSGCLFRDQLRRCMWHAEISSLTANVDSLVDFRAVKNFRRLPAACVQKKNNARYA